MRSWSYLVALFALVALATGNPLAKPEEAAEGEGDEFSQYTLSPAKVYHFLTADTP